MKSFTKPMPSNTPVANAGDHVGDHAKLVDAINELRANVPNQASEVNAAPNVILNASGKVQDTYLASAFIKTINGLSPDAAGNLVIGAGGSYDGSDAVKLTTNQTISGVKSFNSAPTSAVDGINSTELVRRSQLDTKANASATVNLAGDQSVAGVKTFTSPPVSSTAATTANQLVRKNELDQKADATALVTKANSTDVVTLTGSQTIAGTKTFTDAPISATTASVDTQLINFGQVKSLIPGLGTPASLLASQDFTGATNGTVPDYDRNVIPNGNATGASVTIQNNTLRFTSPASGEVNRKFWYSDSPSLDADINLTFWWDGTGSSASAWFVFRMLNTDNVTNRNSGSQVHVSLSSNELNFGRANNGSFSFYSGYGGPKAQTWTPNAKYRLRALLVGQRVRYKVWLASTAEPAAWNLDLVDPTTFNGAVANFGLMVTTGGTATNVFVDDISWYTPATGSTFVQTVNGLTPDINGNVSVTSVLGVNNVTTSYTLATSDNGGAVDVNSASAVNVTVPADSNVNLPVGSVIEVSQLGAGQVTLAPATGVTLRTSSTLKTRVQYSVIAIRKLSANTWLVSGDLS